MIARFCHPRFREDDTCSQSASHGGSYGWNRENDAYLGAHWGLAATRSGCMGRFVSKEREAAYFLDMMRRSSEDCAGGCEAPRLSVWHELRRNQAVSNGPCQ